MLNNESEYNKVALYSTRNIYWRNVGKLTKGYNIVNKDKADQWLTKEGVRSATPEEVARRYGL